MGDKRASRSTAGNHLQHWRLHFHEVTLIEIFANTFNHFGANTKGLTGFLVGNQVDITLTVAHLHIREPFVLLWQWSQSLGE